MDQYPQGQHGSSFEQYEGDVTQVSSDRTPPQDYSGQTEEGYAAGESRSLEDTPSGEIPEETDDQQTGKSRLSSLFGRGGKKNKKEKTEKESAGKKKKKGKKEKREDDENINLEVETSNEKTKKPSKLSGFFKRKKKEDSATVEEETVAMEVAGEMPPSPATPVPSEGVPFAQIYNPSQQVQSQPHPGGYDVNPSDTLQRPPARSTSMKNVTMSLFKRPAAVQDENVEKMELKKPKSSSNTRCSVFLVVILVSGFILGVVLAAAAGDDESLQVIGAVLIVLSLMALIGKIFFTLYMTPEPHPIFRPINDLIKKSMGQGVGFSGHVVGHASYPKQKPPAPIPSQTIVNMSYMEDMETGYSSPVTPGEPSPRGPVKFADFPYEPPTSGENTLDPVFI